MSKLNRVPFLDGNKQSVEGGIAPAYLRNRQGYPDSRTFFEATWEDLLETDTWHPMLPSLFFCWIHRTCFPSLSFPHHSVLKRLGSFCSFPWWLLPSSVRQTLWGRVRVIWELKVAPTRLVVGNWLVHPHCQNCSNILPVLYLVPRSWPRSFLSRKFNKLSLCGQA